jgi:HK97 family phage major capsid protein
MNDQNDPRGGQPPTEITRTFHIERVAGDDGQKTVYRASLSSERQIQDVPWQAPYVLRHTKEAVDLSGLGERGLPMFENHEGYDLDRMLGRIKNVHLAGKRLLGDLKFSEANPRAAQVRGMVDEETLTDMSIKARLLKVQPVRNADGEVEYYDVTRWAPIEASVVGVGADQSVGIGRSSKPATAANARETSMDGENTEVQAGESTAERNEGAPAQGTVQRVEAGRQAVDKERAVTIERNRQQAIRNLAESNSIGDDTVQEWISRGYSLDAVAENILSIHKERGKTAQARTHLGLTDRETRQYSICRAILAAHSRNWKDAGFELECHEEIAKRINKIPETGAFFVPLDVQRRATPVDVGQLAARHGLGYLQRDLNVATPGAGGYLTQTSNMGFDELLRNISFAFRMGVTRLSGLRDNVAIPRQSAAATAEWLTSETDTATESQQTFTQLLLSPKTVSAYTELSRQLLLQSTQDAEGLVNADLAAVCALAVDAAVLNGSGASGQPEGLDNTTGVGAVTGTSLGFAGILEFQTDVAAANVMPARGGYVTTPAVAALMIQRVKYTNTASPLWEGNIWEGMMQGFAAMSTNQVAAATMYFGDWAKAVVAEWGVLEVETNPFANFPAGIIGVRAMYSVDVGIRYPAAFSKADTIT